MNRSGWKKQRRRTGSGTNVGVALLLCAAVVSVIVYSAMEDRTGEGRPARVDEAAPPVPPPAAALVPPPAPAASTQLTASAPAANNAPASAPLAELEHRPLRAMAALTTDPFRFDQEAHPVAETPDADARALLDSPEPFAAQAARKEEGEKGAAEPPKPSLPLSDAVRSESMHAIAEALPLDSPVNSAGKFLRSLDSNGALIPPAGTH